MSVIKTEGLTKVFRVGLRGRRVTALQGLDLEVQAGEVFGFLGPNGSGKTTTIKLLTGLIRPTSGHAAVFGVDIAQVEPRARVGFLPEQPYFYDYLTAEECLAFYGQLFGLSPVELGGRITRLLDLVGLSHARALRLRRFSKGMLQRLGIAQALVNDPELVILDEPMSGLDPIGRREIRDVILRLRTEGKTVFFSTHILPDVELICDRVGIVVEGRLKTVGRLDEILSVEAGTVEVTASGLDAAGLAALQQTGVKVVVSGERVLIVMEPPALPDLPALQDLVDRMLVLIRDHHGRVLSLIPHRRSLEDLFLGEVKGR